jgi:hypothetical protein
MVVRAVLLMSFASTPPPLDVVTPLDGRRRLLAVAILAVFVLSFVPAPFPGGSLWEIAGRLLGK